MNRLAGAFKIRPGEGRLAALLIGLMLFTSAGGSIGGAGIDALFLARFGVQFLPYMYMALGVITFITSLAITALLGRVARERLYVVLPLVLALILIGERAIVALNLPWFYAVMWLGMNVMGTLQGLFTWGLAGTVTDTRQAKRLFPLFGAGNILGAVIGGFITRPLVGIIQSENLLLVWAIASLVAFGLGRALIGRARSEARGRASRRRRVSLIQEMQQGYQYVRRSPLMRWLSIAAVLFSVLFFSLALPFSRAATIEFGDADALAGFLGLFQGISTGAALLASLFLTNRLFTRFGVTNAMLVLPVIYLIGFGALAVAAAFAILVVFRFVQMLWLQGIASTAYQAMLNVVPPQRRDQTRAFIDGVPGQAGIVIAGAILVIGEQALQPQQLYLIGLVTAALNILVLWKARRAYGGALVDALRAGQPQVFYSEEEPFGGFQRDAAAVSAAVSGISNSDPAVRRVSAEILGNLSAPEATHALVGALTDPDAQVRAASLRALAAASAAPALLEVAACIDDPEPEVRLQAIDALRQLTPYPRGVVTYIRSLLGDPDPAIRAHVAVTLLHAGLDQAALDTLRSMLIAKEPAARRSAVEALGEWGDPAGFDGVVSGLSDPVASVRRIAASALARVDPARAIDPLIYALGDDDQSVREAAAAALSQIGPPALAQVVAALAEPALESGALLALERLPAQQAAPAIRAYAREAVARALHYHALERTSNAQPDEARLELLTAALSFTARRYGLRALRAVGLLGDHDSIAVAIDSLKSHDPGQRANALETLEAIGDAPLVRPLLKLWEPVAEIEHAAIGISDAGMVGLLVGLMEDQDAWLRACAALVARESRDPHVHPRLITLAQSDPDALVRETAAWALNGGSTMDTLPTLSLMERILFLRRVPLFADLGPADLKHVASIANELFFAEGEVIAQQGESGDEMYIIVSGEVRVLEGRGHGSEMEVARRKPGEYVGEMSIISHEPRMASLVAAGNVRALCIDHAQFEGILRERPETSLAVMRVLISRLKEIQAR
ncbi:MAG TPA: Npt1/Npt2 family nucleotide transporter [Anaerolineae bacterium]|nr:Npt1/Npt2 family nucleotide transporter [Anaerolineae bacterium]